MNYSPPSPPPQSLCITPLPPAPPVSVSSSTNTAMSTINVGLIETKKRRELFETPVQAKMSSRRPPGLRMDAEIPPGAHNFILLSAANACIWQVRAEPDRIMTEMQGVPLEPEHLKVLHRQVCYFATTKKPLLSGSALLPVSSRRRAPSPSLQSVSYVYYCICWPSILGG